MNLQRCLLWSYHRLLALYPGAFRERFSAEMMEFAEAAEPAEWPLIFADTSVGIARCWMEGCQSTPAAVEPNLYLAIGESAGRRWRLLPGFVLSVGLLVGLCYFSDWTAYRECPNTTSSIVRQ